MGLYSRHFQVKIYSFPEEGWQGPGGGGGGFAPANSVMHVA